MLSVQKIEKDCRDTINCVPTTKYRTFSTNRKLFSLTCNFFCVLILEIFDDDGFM